MTMSQLAELYANFLNKITLNVVNSNFNEDNFKITVPCLNKKLLLLRKDKGYLMKRGFYIVLSAEILL